MTTGVGHWSERHFASLSVGLAILHVVLGLLVFEPTLFPGGDNAGYLILGDALRNGEGYRDLYLPDTPLHVRYPPLLPLLLAGLGWVGGIGVAKVAMLLLTATTVWVTAHFGRMWLSAGAGIAAAALLAVNPTLLEYGHYILSEAPFTLLVVVALWFSLRPDGKSGLCAMLAATAAFATRTAGMTILVALPLAWLLEGRRQRAAWSGAASVGVLGGWALYQRWAAADQPGYVAELLLVDPYTPAAGTVGLSGLLARTAENSWAYVSRVLPETLLGSGMGTGGGALALGVAVATATLAGWAIRSRRRIRAPETLTVLYADLIAAWPSVWTDRRFLLPLVPVLLLLALEALRQLPPHPRRWLAWSAPALIVLCGLLWVGRTAPDRIACVAAYRTGIACEAPANASLYEAAQWARDHTPPDAIIANRKPRLFFWYARRRGDLYPFSSDPATVIQGLEALRADYVVVDQVSGTTQRYLVPAIQAHEARFELVYAGGDPPSAVFRLLASPANVD